jgi:hypothetical protein
VIVVEGGGRFTVVKVTFYLFNGCKSCEYWYYDKLLLNVGQFNLPSDGSQLLATLAKW